MATSRCLGSGFNPTVVQLEDRAHSDLEGEEFHFNPTVVQLEGWNDSADIEAGHRFNPTVVQLEVINALIDGHVVTSFQSY